MSAASMAVIGGGPAGALAAAHLAAAGHAVWIAEERPGWEKPCGGGVTDKALRHYPFLRAALDVHNPVRECALASPAGRQVLLALDRQVAIFARRDLNALLLERARAAGAEVVAQRVVGLAAGDRGWRLALRDGSERRADAVVIAAGARNPFRARVPSPLGAGDWMATAGYYVPLERLPWPRHRMVIQFLPGLEGYIWSFPRADHASIGICAPLGAPPSAELRRTLETWLDRAGVAWRDATFYGHLLPSPTPAGLGRAQFGGSTPAPWALVGDAAGLVDPITGEGLYYALRSGEMLGAAWAKQPDPAAYADAVRRELLPDLLAAGRIAPRFYRGRFLGAPVLERMALFTQRSPRFRQLMCDLFSGAQGYLDLRPRLYRQLVPSLWQLAFGAR